MTSEATTDARSEILAQLRRSLPASAGRPAVEPSNWIRFDDPLSRFTESVASVGGAVTAVTDRAAADAVVREAEVFRESQHRVSLVDDVADTTVDYGAIEDPHDVSFVELAVLPGAFAVAENGAVWVTASDPKDRVLHFLTQHLVLVVDGPVLNNMHEAYERIDPQSVPFSAFLSGPSKTADIEQSLVIGAHGSRSLMVVVIAGEDS